MFKRKNESERARFSRALTGQATAPDAKDGDEPPQEQAGLTSARTSGAMADGPNTPPIQDVNVSVGRPARPSEFGQPGEAETVIGERTFFGGSFKTQQSVRIRGTIQGEVQSAGEIIIEPAARVIAKVLGAGVTVAGQVDGQIACGGWN